VGDADGFPYCTKVGGEEGAPYCTNVGALLGPDTTGFGTFVGFEGETEPGI